MEKMSLHMQFLKFQSIINLQTVPGLEIHIVS